jgi:F0F1-type ATP synthase assembly protein I
VKEKEAKSWAKAGAYTGLAFILPVAMLVCYYLGDWADRKLGTRFFYLIGIMVGLAAGLWETVRQADRIENGIRTGKNNTNGNKRG